MQYAHPYLKDVTGLLNYKMMGSGVGKGFNPWPDWSVYALLQVWENQESADHFLEKSDLMNKFSSRSINSISFFMRNIRSYGAWGGVNPFEKVEHERGGMIAVITRATIKKSKLIRFWSYVPRSQRGLLQNKELLFSKGIGEIPIVQMATFSLWKSEKGIVQYAYENDPHKEAIRRTKKYNWYKEELFARFAVIKYRGSWEGLDLDPDLAE